MEQLSQKRINELLLAERKLSALERQGVDNWDGYELAMEEIAKGKAEELAIDEAFENICQTLAEGAYEPAEHRDGVTFKDVDYEFCTKMLRELIEKAIAIRKGE